MESVGGFLMTISLLPNLIIFEGILDENSNLDVVENHFKNHHSGEPICVDFSKVRFGNSIGIVKWLRVLLNHNMRIDYINAPIWLVKQFNMISTFLEKGDWVSSLYIPYYCADTDEELLVKMDIGKDIPILKNYSSFKLEDRDVDQKTFEPDIAPSLYFDFIAKNYETFDFHFSKLSKISS